MNDMTEEERKLIAQRDLELINAHLESLNREAEETLRYQVPLDLLFASDKPESTERQ
jgi:hypothetical protein